jgi:hypothetical protein
VTFNDELESVVVESSAFGQQTGEGQETDAPNASTPAPPLPSPPAPPQQDPRPPSPPAATLAPSKRPSPAVQQTASYGLGFHWSPHVGSGLFSVGGMGSPIPRENITVVSSAVVGHSADGQFHNYGPPKQLDNGKPKWTTVIRTQPSLPSGAGEDGPVFRASTISRVVVPSPATK